MALEFRLLDHPRLRVKHVLKFLFSVGQRHGRFMGVLLFSGLIHVHREMRFLERIVLSIGSMAASEAGLAVDIVSCF